MPKQPTQTVEGVLYALGYRRVSVGQLFPELVGSPFCRRCAKDLGPGQHVADGDTESPCRGCGWPTFGRIA